MSQFYVGQKVVCVDGSYSGHGLANASYPKEGSIYTVASQPFLNYWGRFAISIKEMPHPDPDVQWSVHRFRPIDSLTEQMDRIEQEGAPVELEPEYA